MLAKFMSEVHVSHSLRDVLGVRRVVPNVERAINLLIIPSAPKTSIDEERAGTQKQTRRKSAKRTAKSAKRAAQHIRRAA